MMPTTCAFRAVLPALALIGAICLAAGCKSQPDPIRYSEMTPEDLEFAESVDRPPMAGTLYTLGRLLAAQGKEVQAEATLLTCIQKYPHHAPAYAELAALHVRARRYDRAVSILEDGLRVAPKNPILHNNLGMCFLLSGNYERSLSEFARAAETWPDNSRLRSNQALATGMLGRYDEAMSIYLTFLPDKDAHFNLGVICEARGDTERAALEFALAEGKVPEDATAQRN
jgi:tetratricopeptide (TPR) repeat protein